MRNQSGSVTTSAYVHLGGIFLWSTALAGGGNAEWRPWVVLMPGDVLNLSVSVSSGVNFTVSGSIYDI